MRVRIDEPIQTVLANGMEMRDAAMPSGAQLIMTDWPSVGMASRYNSSYVVRFEWAATVRCNTLSGGKGCKEKDLEKL